MKPGLYLLGSDMELLFEATDPESLSGYHRTWQDDILRFSPWSGHGQAEETKNSDLRLWRSESVKCQSAILVCGKCSSTMDAIRRLTDTCGLMPWDALVAARQQKGRGQAERSWISPPGNLYVSWYWPELESIDGATFGWQAMASLLAGYLVASSLESFGADIRIKWPNDLLADDRKICGILVENRGGRLVVGIGVNIAYAPPKQSLTDEFALPAVCLDDLGIHISALQLFLHLAETGRKRLESIVRSLTPEQFVMQVRKRLAWQGRTVTIRRSFHEAVSGQIIGIAADGGLIVKIDEKTEVIYTGSILPEENINYRL